MSLGPDRSAWKRVAFGDVVHNVNVAVRDPEAEGIERIIAMEHMDPGELKVQRWGSLEEGTTFTRRVKPGQTLFGKRRAYQRKVAYAEFDAICSGDIYTFEPDAAEMLQEFLPFLVQSDEFFDHALGTSAGSLSPRTNWRDLARFEFDLPPRDEQRRIADLLWAIERHRLAVREVGRAGHAALQFQLAALLGAMQSTQRLGDVASTRSGPSFAASAVSGAPASGALPVLGIPNTRPDGTIDLSGAGYVSGLPGSTRTVDEASLILIRTNGNRQRIGNAYLPPADAHGYAVSAFQFLMQLHDPSYREFLYWVLKSEDMQARMSEAASGTTGLGNLAVTWLNAQEIPWPASAAERDVILAMLGAFGSASCAVGEEATALGALRAAALSDFFGGS